jgi:type I restriction enzyme S subunit
MEVRRGYKQTEVGIIPNDWQVMNFGDIVDYVKGFAFKSKDYQKDGIKIIRVSDTTYDSIKKENGIYIDEKRVNKFRKWKLNEYDLIFSTVGSKPPMYDSMVGKVIMVSKEFGGSLLNQNAVLIRNKSRKNYKQILLLNHFRTKRFQQHIEDIYRGNANQASITLKDLFKFVIPVAKEEDEQLAIATALSDAEALITSLEKLIAKKRNIKRGAMQQLLTGKKRLPGFSERWEVVPLSNLIHVPVTDGPHLTPKFIQDGIPFLSVNNLVNNRIDLSNLRYISKHDHDVFSKKCKPQKDDILMGKAASVGLVALVDLDRDFNIWSPIALIRLNNKNIAKFIYYSFQSIFVINQIRLFTNSSSQGNIGMGDIEKIEFSVPSKEEQAAIAKVLSDMDAEIESLEHKLKKYKLLKQGMMQELLTGKTRLV